MVNGCCLAGNADTTHIGIFMLSVLTAAFNRDHIHWIIFIQNIFIDLLVCRNVHILYIQLFQFKKSLAVFICDNDRMKSQMVKGLRYGNGAKRAIRFCITSHIESGGQKNGSTLCVKKLFCCGPAIAIFQILFQNIHSSFRITKHYVFRC